MSGINTDTQFFGQLGNLKLEIGYVKVGDITLATNVQAADLSETRSVPTTLEHVAVGWMVCSSTSGGVGGCITGAGSVCQAHASGGRMIDFTIDSTACSGVTDSDTNGGDYYIILGW